MNISSLFSTMDPSSFHTRHSENEDSFQNDCTESTEEEEEEDFDSNRSQSTEENCEKFTEVAKKKGDLLVDRDQDKFQITREQKAKIIARLKRKRSGPFIGQSAEKF